MTRGKCNTKIESRHQHQHLVLQLVHERTAARAVVHLHGYCLVPPLLPRHPAQGDLFAKSRPVCFPLQYVYSMVQVHPELLGEAFGTCHVALDVANRAAPTQKRVGGEDREEQNSWAHP